MHTGVHFGESNPHKTNRFLPVLHVVIVKLHAVDGTDSSFVADAPSAASGISGQTLHQFLAGNLVRLTWVRLRPPPEQRYPFQEVCSIFVCPNTGMADSVKDC